jgi:adenylate cyclase
MSRKASEIDPKSAETISFGGFVFLTNSKELQTVEGRAVDLRSQSAEVLSMLAARPGEIVSKNALMQTVWADTFVTDDSLVQCIADIRRALRDDAHVIVETIPKRGYRLNAATLNRADSAAGAHRGRPQFAEKAGRTAIAVLPFVNLSNDPEQDYFSDGVTEDLIMELGRFRDVTVIARASSFAYRGAALNLERFGAELGARYVVEGTVRRGDDRLRINVQLLDTATGKHLLAERYDRSSVEIWELEHEVVQKIVARITGRVSQADHDRALQMSADELAAYDCWLRGQHATLEWTPKTEEEAFKWFDAALARDPHFARAHSSIALLLNVSATVRPGYENQEVDRDRALKHARLAVQCDNEDARSHYSLGAVSLLRGDLAVAERHYRLTEELNPNDADTIMNCAFAAAALRDASKARELAERAIKLNPLHADWYYYLLSGTHFIIGEYERCFEVGHPYIDFFPELAGWTAAALGLLGREAEAGNEGARFLRIVEACWAGRQPFTPPKAVEWFLYINNCVRGPPRDELIRGLRIAGLPVP